MSNIRRCAVPLAVWMVLFTLVPLGIVLWLALTDQNGAFTFQNIFAIGQYADTLWYSVRLGAVATVLCLLLAYPLAYSISRSGERVQQTMVMIVMLPMWMNFLLRTYAWMSILENNGFINQFLGLFGIGPLQLIYTDGAIVLGMVYNFLPFMVLPLYSVMVKIDRTVIEAAQDLGAGRVQVFRRVILPLSVPGIVNGVTMVFVPSVSTFVISKLLGGKTMMIGDIIETMFVGSAPNFHVGSALSLVLMVLILICMAFMSLVDKDPEESGVGFG